MLRAHRVRVRVRCVERASVFQVDLDELDARQTRELLRFRRVGVPDRGADDETMVGARQCADDRTA